MTTKPPSSRLAASGHADDPESDEQVTKDHNEDDGNDDITVDPSGDVTVEATEDVTSEAVSRTPHPTIRPGSFAADSGGTPAPTPRAPTLLGVPIQSLPLPGVTASSLQDQDGDETRTIDYNDEITVLAAPSPADPLAALDALDALDRPSITDDDEEETKVEPAEAAMKAAASIDDVTTALSAQASLEREKALRRSASPASSLSDDLEFADPDAEDDEQQEEEESLDDELSDEDEVISAGGAIEEEEDLATDDDDDDARTGDGVATATFMKSPDSTGLSGLLNPRRPPTGGREGFGSRLPTPYSQAASAPAPSTSPFASRLGPAPTASPYSGRGTGTSIPAIQIPPPSAEAVTQTDPGFMTRRLSVPAYALVALVAGSLFAGFGVRGLFSGGAAPAPATVTAKSTPAAPAAPVVVPVGTTPPTAETKPAVPPVEAAKPAPTIADLPGSEPVPTDTPESGLWKPAKKKPAAHKAAPVEPLADDTAAKPTPKPAVATTPRPAGTAVASTPKPAPAVASTPKPAASKPAKKPTKVWVDPFAN